jgi:hypothetical protein
MNINLEKIATRDPKLYITLCDTYLIRGTDNIKVLNLPEAKFNWLAPEIRERILVLEREFESETDAAKQKHETDKQAALARLVQYTKERGLLDAPSNGFAVKEWIDTNVKGYWSVAAVDAAVSILGPRGTNILLWAVPKAPEPPPVVEEPVRYLANGERELDINAGDSEMRAASVQQLRDLSRRRNEGKQTWRTGWVGAAFK